MKRTKAEREDALRMLRGMMQPGDTVYTVLLSRARSGMSRTLDVYAFLPCPDEGPRAVTKRRLTMLVSKVVGYRYEERSEAIRVEGCGFDAGHDVVYNLDYMLFPDDHTPLRHEWIG